MPSPTPPLDAAALLHLRGEGISFSYPGRAVLTDVSLVVPGGRPTGLLGENGSGKSTLLAILAGDLTPDAGTLDVPGPLGLLHQEPPFPATASLQDVVEDALERSRELERRLTDAGEALAAEDPEEPGGRAAARHYDQLLDRATLADVWNAEQRAARVVDGLGLRGVSPARTLDRLSGGQRGRLALAHLLIARPTTLLLDEPTNHLDDDAARFLADLLGGHPGPVLVASHDRAFLDEATQAQLDLDPAPTPLDREPGGLVAYTGSFTDYLHARLDARERWERRFRVEQEELDRLREARRDAHAVGHADRGPRTEARAAKKFYADRNATVVSRRVRDAQRRLEELEASQVRKPPQELHFAGLPAVRVGPAGEVLAALSGAAVPGRLEAVDLSLAAGEKLLITGPNGSGKSTLLALLAGTLDAARGTVSVTGDRGLLAQDEQVEEDRSPRELLGGPDLHGLLHPQDLDRPLGELSRGQQRRVALAALLQRPRALLLLDEPTNHLGLDLATRLERAVQESPGAVVIASHDRWLRARWQGRRLDLGAREH